MTIARESNLPSPRKRKNTKTTHTTKKTTQQGGVKCYMKEEAQSLEMTLEGDLFPVME